MTATVGTRLMIWWKGEFVGEDEFANRYFKEKRGRRRWVIYGGKTGGIGRAAGLARLVAPHL